MNLKQLEYFMELAGTLNYTKASRKMYVSQTAVTKQIQNLERELGVKLFERGNRQVRLTEVGEMYVEEARRILQDVEDSIDHVRSYQRGERGNLKIGFLKEMDMEILIPLIKLFHERYPDIELDFGSDSSRHLREKLNGGKQDLIICTESKETEDFIKWRIGEYPLVGIVHRKDELAEKETVRSEEFRNLVYDLRGGSEGRINMDLEGALLKVACDLGQAIAHEFVVDQSMRRYVVTLPLEP